MMSPESKQNSVKNASSPRGKRRKVNENSGQPFDPSAHLRGFLNRYTKSHGEILHVLIAVSGGADSMALLAAAEETAQRSGFRISAAHLVHNAEAEEPRRRADLVKDYCEKKRIHLVLETLSSPADPDLSPEEWMRRERYRFLEREAEARGCDVILTAHHADDQAETVLFRVLSGTGLKGLRGVREQRGRILRPFLNVRKSALQEYCRSRNVPYLEDPSNRELNAPRNYIRHELLPRIETDLNPEAVGALNRLSRWAEEADEVFQALVDECWRKSLRNFQKGKIILDLHSILAYFTLIRKYTVQKALSEVAGREVALSAAELDRIAAFLQHSRTGTALIFNGNLKVSRDRHQLVVASSRQPELYRVLTPGEDVAIPELAAVLKWEPVRGKSRFSGETLTADLDLGENPPRLLLRYAQEGDRFYPLGAPGGKRLFRFLADQKVSRLEKHTTPVLLRGNEIVWVIGHRISESARVRKPGEGAWRLRLIPSE